MAKLGKPKNIATPLIFLELYDKYRKYCKDNPRVENVLHQKTGEIIQIPREKPLTWAGFDTWLWRNDYIAHTEDYRSNKEGRYSEYAGVIARITEDMYQDKFTGASVGIFNANIIARDLGLKDQTENRNYNKDISNLSDEDLDKEINELKD